MNKNPGNIIKKLRQREEADALRTLRTQQHFVDFSSNDYLGFANKQEIFDEVQQYMTSHDLKSNGSTGSRLLRGNHALYETVEQMLCEFYRSDSALIFNSGYDANLGLMACIAERNDILLYDELSHASIRDGIQLSKARAFKFKHNNLQDLEKQLAKNTKGNATIFIISEAVFSMDGDSPDLKSLAALCDQYGAYLIVDEAHATGLFGTSGEGLLHELGLTESVFARIVTFGKALGCHGAAILGSTDLKDYLINFARSFIYTTALPPHSLATILIAHRHLNPDLEIKALRRNIAYFNTMIQQNNLSQKFIESDTAIHCCIIPGNKHVKNAAKELQRHDFDVRPILSPTVPQGEERLRFCVHSFNSYEEISEVLALLATFA